LGRRNHECEGCRGLRVLVRSLSGQATFADDAENLGSFWSYEVSKQAISSPADTDRQAALKVLLCGGLAGVVTWASIFPLDVVKTRVQTQSVALDPVAATLPAEERPLRGGIATQAPQTERRIGAIAMARMAYQTEGYAVFFRGLGICSVRAFVVNAVQWAVYEWMMRMLRRDLGGGLTT